MGVAMSEEMLRVENLHVSVEGTSIIKGLNPVSYTHLTLPTN